jgi:osmotically-inducible protein OsmY
MQNDILLQRDVLAALEREEGVIRGSIGAGVHHGVVKLAGRVRSELIRQRSELATRNVAGVSSVVMDIDIVN